MLQHIKNIIVCHTKLDLIIVLFAPHVESRMEGIFHLCWFLRSLSQALGCLVDVCAVRGAEVSSFLVRTPSRLLGSEMALLDPRPNGLQIVSITRSLDHRLFFTSRCSSCPKPLHVFLIRFELLCSLVVCLLRGAPSAAAWNFSCLSLIAVPHYRCKCAGQQPITSSGTVVSSAFGASDSSAAPPSTDCSSSTPVFPLEICHFFSRQNWNTLAFQHV